MKSLRPAFNHIKWAWQRLYRGWDDRVIWSIDYYLAKNLPIWIEGIKKHESVPSTFIVNESNEEWRYGREEWIKVLDEIILGFNTAQKIINGDSNAWDEFFIEYEKQYGSFGDMLKSPFKLTDIMTKLNTIERDKKEKEEMLLQFDKSMDLFKKHFFDLWS